MLGKRNCFLSVSGRRLSLQDRRSTSWSRFGVTFVGMFPVSAVRPDLLLLQAQIVPSVQVGLRRPVLVLLLLNSMYIHVYNTASFSADTGINTTNHMQMDSGRKEDSKRVSGKCTFLQVEVTSTNPEKVLFFKHKQCFLTNLFRIFPFGWDGFHWTSSSGDCKMRQFLCFFFELSQNLFFLVLIRPLKIQL